MDILAVSGTHPDPVNPHWGVFVRRSLASLVKGGTQVEAVAPRPVVPPVSLPFGLERFRGTPRRHQYEYPVHYPRYPYLPPQTMLYAFTGLSYRRFVGKYVLRNCKRPDIVHAQFEFPDGFGVVALAKSWKCPLVLSSHGSMLQRHAHGRLHSPMVREAIRRAALVCAVSERQARLAAEITGDAARVVLVPLGVDVRRFTPDGRRSELPFTVLFVGRLVREKGIDDLLSGFAMAAAGDPQIRLRVVGDGPLATWAHRRVTTLGLANQVVFLGSLDEEHLLQEYRGAHVLALPSRGEGRPVVVYEAMSCELPVVASDVGGIPEQLEDERTGFLIPRNSPSELAERISFLRENPSVGPRMGKDGRERVLREGWTWEAHADRLLALYESVLDESADGTQLHA